jgi:hypothetical protein
VLGEVIYNQTKDQSAEALKIIVEENKLKGSKEGVEQCLIRDVQNDDLKRLMWLIDEGGSILDVCSVPLASAFIFINVNPKTFKENKKLNPTFISQLEPFFSRVWLSSEEARLDVINLFHNEHDVANELLGFSEEDWELSKKYYNTVNFNSIYHVGEPENYNIKVEVTFDGVDSNTDLFLKNLTNISDIIKPSESGIYELGCAKIFVNHVVSTSKQNIRVENPPFDYSLLTIS